MNTLTLRLQKCKILNGTTLKLLWIILMVFDHIHQIFIKRDMPLRLTMLGRPVMPIFLFMLAEGMHYTHSRKNYLLLLLGGSVLMTVASSLITAFFPIPYLFEGMEQVLMLTNNVFATLFIAGVYIIAWDVLKEGFQKQSVKKILASIGIGFLPILSYLPMIILPQLVMSGTLLPSWVITTALAIPSIFSVEGGPVMVLLAVLFYIFRKQRLRQVALLALISICTYFLSDSVQRMMIFAVIPLLMYNGQKGKGWKYFFYVFYPAHIFLLYFIAYFMW